MVKTEEKPVEIQKETIQEAEKVKEARKAEERARKEAEQLAKEKAKEEADKVREREKREAEKVKEARKAEERARKEAEQLAKDKAKEEADKEAKAEALYEGRVKLMLMPPVDSEHMKEIGENLSKLKGLRLLLVGGSIEGGAQIVISVKKPTPLIKALKQMPLVEDAADNGKEIQVWLKPNENNHIQII